jgi:nicotinamidase-related amidase
MMMMMTTTTIQKLAFFCAGIAVHYRFGGGMRVFSKKKKKKSSTTEEEQEEEVKRVLKRSEKLAENKDAMAGETRVSCRKNDEEEEEERYFPVHAENTALVIIDMQRDFLEETGRLGKFYSKDILERLRETTANVATVLEKCREKGITIAHSRSHRYGASIRRDLLLGVDVSGGKYSPIEGVDETYNFVDALKPKEGEIIVDKWTFGAFASTKLEKHLLDRGVERILLCGILTNVCVMATAVQACDRFFRVCLVEDACGAFGKEKKGGWHDKAVELINGPQIAKQNHHKSCGLYFGEVASVEAVVNALDALK